jgi:hypothetical protein
MNHNTLISGANHPARGRASVPPPARPSWRRWTKGIYQGVLGAGALAGAVAAILAIRVPHDVEDAAGFKNMSVIPGVPFNEYEQRLVAPHPRSQGLGRIELPMMRAVADESPAPEPEITPTPFDTSPTPPEETHSNDGGSSQDDSTGTESSTDSSSTNASIFRQVEPPVPGAPKIVLPTPQTPQAAKVMRQARIKTENACELDAYACKQLALLTFSPTDSAGKPTTSAAAAKRQIATLKKLRTTRVKGHRKPQPVGVVVVANIDLSGLRGKPVLLSWSMWRSGGGQRLYGDWLNQQLAYRIEATSDHDTASVDFWIPLPRSKGPYFVQSQLAIGGTTLASSDSRSFD